MFELTKLPEFTLINADESPLRFTVFVPVKPLTVTAEKVTVELAVTPDAVEMLDGLKDTVSAPNLTALALIRQVVIESLESPLTN